MKCSTFVTGMAKGSEFDCSIFDHSGLDFNKAHRIRRERNLNYQLLISESDHREDFMQESRFFKAKKIYAVVDTDV
jgi:hypothetical protein